MTVIKVLEGFCWNIKTLERRRRRRSLHHPDKTTRGPETIAVLTGHQKSRSSVLTHRLNTCDSSGLQCFIAHVYCVCVCVRGIVLLKTSGNLKSSVEFSPKNRRKSVVGGK